MHFPIALLVVYAIMELIHTNRFTHSNTYAKVKGFLVILGTFSAYLTLATGELASELLVQSRPELERLIETHATLAGASTAIFSILALSYLIKFLLDSKHAAAPVLAAKLFSNIVAALKWYSEAIREHVLGQMLALAGIICITIASALGAAIVYGPDVDPLVNFIYRMFF